MAEKLRDLSQPIDVALLDATVAAFYGTGSKEEVSIIHSLPRIGWCFRQLVGRHGVRVLIFGFFFLCLLLWEEGRRVGYSCMRFL